MIWLTPEQAQALIAHAQSDAPREACGILAGRHDSRGFATVNEVIPVPNAAAEPLVTYYMDERAMAAALSSLETRGLDLIGFYHSHPKGDPIPSATDIRQATYPDTPYLIIGLKRDADPFAAWKMRPGRVDPVPLHIGIQPPEATRPPLSRAERAAIIVAALICFALLIVVSLTLLPPAPAIPP